MATKTLTVAAPSSSCNGQVNPQEPIQVTVMYSQSGILGWKKRTLYLLLILLVSVVVINMTLILWIIKILDLTSSGPGKMRIYERGIQLESGAEFLDTLTASQILVTEHQTLKLESARNVTFISKDSRGQITNYLSLGGAGLQAIGGDFSIRSKINDILLHVDPREMVVSANNIIVSDSGGFRLDGSLESPLIRGSATKDLRLESLLKRVKVRSEKDLNVDSPAGGIFVTGLKNMNLKSTGGRVIVDSSKLQMKNLRTASHSKAKVPTEVFQVCMCDNGRIFLAHRQGYCQIQDTVCKEPMPDNFRSYYNRS